MSDTFLIPCSLSRGSIPFSVESNGTRAAVVISSVVGSVIIMALVALVLIYHRRRRQAARAVSNPSMSEVESAHSVVAVGEINHPHLPRAKNGPLSLAIPHLPAQPLQSLDQIPAHLPPDIPANDAPSSPFRPIHRNFKSLSTIVSAQSLVYVPSPASSSSLSLSSSSCSSSSCSSCSLGLKSTCVASSIDLNKQDAGSIRGVNVYDAGKTAGEAAAG